MEVISEKTPENVPIKIEPESESEPMSQLTDHKETIYDSLKETSRVSKQWKTWRGLMFVDGLKIIDFRKLEHYKSLKS